MLPLPSPVEVLLATVHLDPGNFRRDYGNLDGLTESVRKYGILQPPGLWLDPDRGHYVIWGNKRTLAAKKLGLESILARVFPGPLDAGLADILQLVENVQRTDLKPSEQANGFRQLIVQQSLTASQLAAQLDISNGTVTKKLALLKLIPPLLAKVDAGDLPETVGYECSGLSEAVQFDLVERLKGRVTRADFQSARQDLEPRGKRKTVVRPAIVKRGPLDCTMRGEKVRLEGFINELQSMLDEAKKAHDNGITSLNDFAKSLKNTRATA